MLLASILISIARVWANYRLVKFKADGWWWKAATIPAFIWVNWELGLHGFYVLNILDAVVTVKGVQEWKAWSASIASGASVAVATTSPASLTDMLPRSLRTQPSPPLTAFRR